MQSVVTYIRVEELKNQLNIKGVASDMGVAQKLSCPQESRGSW